jgi:hypothetical protein
MQMYEGVRTFWSGMSLPRLDQALFRPQAKALPSSLIANAYSKPAEICTMPLRFGTSFGWSELVVVPSPSCPEAFDPHAYTVPSLFRAMEKLDPTAIAAMLVSPGTCITVFTSVPVVVPFPSSPLLFPPHAYTVPSLFRARLWEELPATATMFESPGICTGVRLSVIVFLQICAPHQYTVPFFLSAREWFSRAKT